MEYLNEQTKLEHPECRCDTPNNIGASNIRPNTPDPNIACPTPICPNPMRLWVIKYAITGTAKFIGQAIVQAPTIEQAQCIFGKDSRFNGYVDRLKITCCHEVFPRPEPILLQEDCVAIIDRRNLKTYPFILKSDFDNVISDVYASIAKIIEDTKKEVYNGLEGDNYITIEVASDYSTCVISHADSGVTAGEYGDILEEQQESKTPDFGDSVKIMSLIVDSQGHITEIEDHLVTIPDTEATQLLHGLMSALDKKKLDEIGIDTTNTTALTPANELFDSVANSNVIQLHKIAKTGTFSDLLNIPDGILTINYPKGDGTTETKTFTDNADTNETVTIPSEIDDTLAQDYKTYSSNKIEDFVDNAIGKGELIIQKNGTPLLVNYSDEHNNSQTKQAFGANDYNYCIVNIPVPTQTSELTNNGEGVQDYPFITKAVNNLENYYTEAEVDNLLSQLETNIDWKEAVNTYADIATTYPNPQDGWTVNVKDTDYTYRYDGTNWVAISANAIPLATQSVNGLMSSTDKTKLDGIEAGAEVNVQSDWNQSNSSSDDYIKNKPTIGNGKLTITVNNDNNNKLEFNANQTNDTTFNINTETNVFRTAITKNGNNVDVLYDNKDWGIGVNSNNQLQINGKFVKQVENLDNYTTAPDGEIVEYIGPTNNDYTNGYFYKFHQGSSTAEYETITIPANKTYITYHFPDGTEETGYEFSDERYEISGAWMRNLNLNVTSSDNGTYLNGDKWNVFLPISKAEDLITYDEQYIGQIESIIVEVNNPNAGLTDYIQISNYSATIECSSLQNAIDIYKTLCDEHNLTYSPYNNTYFTVKGVNVVNDNNHYQITTGNSSSGVGEGHALQLISLTGKILLLESDNDLLHRIATEIREGDMIFLLNDGTTEDGRENNIYYYNNPHYNPPTTVTRGTTTEPVTLTVPILYNDDGTLKDIETTPASWERIDVQPSPTIPTVNNATLTIQVNGTTLQTFSANDDTNKVANIQTSNIVFRQWSTE